MNSQVRRLILAAGLSGIGFATTLLWYKSTEKHNSLNLEAPLAQVGQVSDEVLRRPPTRLLWHSVNTGDPLFNGEAIRTSLNGEVRIQFEDGRFIDLESDSLIVLSKAEGEVSLDLMEGSLFVNSQQANQEKGSTGLVLNSAQGKVDLSKASASLSKAVGQNLSLQIVEGSAQVESNDGKTQELSKGKTGTLGSQGMQFDSSQLKIISPLPNKAVYLDPSQKPEVNFKWTGLPEGWKTQILTGQNRKKLINVTQVELGKAEATQLYSIGRHYWKIKATNQENPNQSVESPIYRLDVMARSTPTPLSPTANSQIEIEEFPSQLQLQWQKSDEASGYIVEIATDAQLKNKIKAERLNTVDRFELENLNAGDYYWRLSSIYPDTEKPWVGKVQKFSLVKKAETAPVSIQVNWDNINKTQYYITAPELELKWTAGKDQKEVANWKLTWKNLTNPEVSEGQLETTDTKNKAVLTAPGRYLASIEAFDKKARRIGAAETAEIEVKEMPLLSAPELLPAGEILKAENSGRSQLNWTPVEGATEYQLVIKTNKEGNKEVLNKKYKGTHATLQNLMPGEYTLEILSIDQFGRSGSPTTSRTLVVPDKSNLRAPAMKKVKVN